GSLGRPKQYRQRPHHPQVIQPPRLLVSRRGGTGFPRDPSPTHAKLQTQAVNAGGGGSDRRILQQGAKANAGTGDLHRAKVRVQASKGKARSSPVHERTRADRAARETRDASGGVTHHEVSSRMRGRCWGGPVNRETCIKWVADE